VSNCPRDTSRLFDRDRTASSPVPLAECLLLQEEFSAKLANYASRLMRLPMRRRLDESCRQTRRSEACKENNDPSRLASDILAAPPIQHHLESIMSVQSRLKLLYGVIINKRIDMRENQISTVAYQTQMCHKQGEQGLESLQYPVKEGRECCKLPCFRGLGERPPGTFLLGWNHLMKRTC
jgi:hypothetical protein